MDQHEVILEWKADGICRKISCRKDQSVLEALRNAGIYLTAVCSGRGTCGKCRIRVITGKAEPSREDRIFLSEEEIKKGFRLACKCFPQEDMVITVAECSEEEMAVLGESTENCTEAKQGGGIRTGSCRYGIAIDIGTTTIAMVLYDQDTLKTVRQYTGINHQRAYGADVINRIQASNEGKGKELQELIRQDLQKGLQELFRETCRGECSGNDGGKDNAIDTQWKMDNAVIACNMTMTHLLMGYPCDRLGIFPFTPYNSDKIETTMGELLGECCSRELAGLRTVIYPGISAFVGGDIVSDLVYCGMDSAQDVTVLLDLGTNGEMAVGNRERILVTSTAAGPAFEGGNIACGTGSIPGAICGVIIREGKPALSTVMDQLPPVGICGTGVIETVYEMRKQGLIDETGALEEEYFETGYFLGKDREGKEIRFYQKDIRELQLAKSAVRAGVETLLLRYGVTAKQVKKVYLAGGFGYRIDVRKAVGIGLLPEAFADKVEAIGNGSLKGAMAYGCKEEEAVERIERIRKAAASIDLSNEEGFNDLYMEHMFFDERTLLGIG